MDHRLESLKTWLTTALKSTKFSVQPASEDASFRRYFRVTTEQGTYIAMDAPPIQEPIAPFIKTCTALVHQQVNAPHIYAQNQEDGFLLLADFGNQNYLDQLKHNANYLYACAIKSLVQIQRGVFEQAELDIPLYNHELLNNELDVFVEWFVEHHCQTELSIDQQQQWHSLKTLLIESCLEQPQVWVHRDYHSRNLMVTEINNPGVIDFQDMVIGPISYDLVSLFKDCYIEWPRARQLDWCNQYYQLAEQQLPEFQFTEQQLIRWYDLTGLQRHLKVLGVFCRLNYRDGKTHYMHDLPLVKKHVQNVFECQAELQPFQTFIYGLINER